MNQLISSFCKIFTIFLNTKIKQKIKFLNFNNNYWYFFSDHLTLYTNSIVIECGSVQCCVKDYTEKIFPWPQLKQEVDKSRTFEVYIHFHRGTGEGQEGWKKFEKAGLVPKSDSFSLISNGQEFKTQGYSNMVSELNWFPKDAKIKYHDHDKLGTTLGETFVLFDWKSDWHNGSIFSGGIPLQQYSCGTIGDVSIQVREPAKVDLELEKKEMKEGFEAFGQMSGQMFQGVSLLSQGKTQEGFGSFGKSMGTGFGYGLKLYDQQQTEQQQKQQQTSGTGTVNTNNSQKQFNQSSQQQSGGFGFGMNMPGFGNFGGFGMGNNNQQQPQQQEQQQQLGGFGMNMPGFGGFGQQQPQMFGMQGFGGGGFGGQQQQQQQQTQGQQQQQQNPFGMNMGGFGGNMFGGQK